MTDPAHNHRTRVQPSRFPRRLRLVRNPDVWIVQGYYRHFWPNGDACTVDIAAGDSRWSAIRRALFKVVGR